MTRRPVGWTRNSDGQATRGWKVGLSLFWGAIAVHNDDDPGLPLEAFLDRYTPQSFESVDRLRDALGAHLNGLRETQAETGHSSALDLIAREMGLTRSAISTFNARMY